MTDRGTNTLAARGLEELFFQLCCCVSFLVVAEIVLGDTYLPYQLCIVSFFCCSGKLFLVAQVGFLVVAGKSFRCYFLTYHISCAVVSVFWLRREIVFGYSVSKKDSYSVSLRERRTASKCIYFVRSNTLLLCVFTLASRGLEDPAHASRGLEERNKN